ncbi:TPA: DoxX family protein [Candidatus Woesearchaeota archaeon]|nr:DoxX family protein [Candidatus Woesearchaeota archaeon]
MSYLESVKKFEPQLYLVFRVVFGLLFFAHGAQKLFGWFGGTPLELASLMGVAGIVEFLAGLGIALGFFTRLAALGGVVNMVVAYAMVHAPQNWMPLVNQGELALLYLFGFLVVLAHGAGEWSVEKSLLRKELF